MTNIHSAIDVMGIEITEPSTLIFAAINLHRQRLPLDAKVDYGCLASRVGAWSEQTVTHDMV